MKCAKCAGVMVKCGSRAYSGSIIKQRYRCKSCHTNEYHEITRGVISGGSATSSNSMNIRSTYRTGNKKSTCTVNIPAELARKAGIYEPSAVVIEETGNGSLLIRRLELQ